jgi:uncharacterized protein involved in exopolysaccharide biosynthesis
MRRYALACGLALALGIAGAAVGWRMTEPVYQSHGIIHVVLAIPTPRDPEGRAVRPDADAFVEAQAALLQSRRVIEKALENRDWLTTGTHCDLAEFRERLQVDRRDGSRHFVPRFTHRKPEVAAAGVKAVIRAYVELAEETAGAHGAKALARVESTLVKQLRDLDDEARELVAQYAGQDGLKTRLESLLREVARLEQLRFNLDLELELLKPGEEADHLIAGRALIDEQIASVKAEARKLGEARTLLQRLLAEREIVRERFAIAKEAREAEMAARGTVRVLSQGDLPVAPHEDRRKASAVGFGAAGIGLGVFLAMLPGLLRRRRKEDAN